jgi:hypothetical protein
VKSFRQIVRILLGIALFFPSVAWAQQLTITSPSAGTVVAPGQTLVVTVSVSSGSVAAVLVAAQDIGATAFQTTAPYSFSLTIPQAVVGLKNLTAFGVTGPEQVVTSAPVQIDVELSAQATSLTASLQQVQFGFAGDQFPLDVTATFADGSQSDVTQSTQVTFASADSKVATVDSTGLVTATGAGTTQISIKYGGQSTSVQVTVPIEVVGDLNGDGKVTADDMRILQAFVGTNAVGTSDARDLNGDGIINASDVKILETLCGSACSNIVSVTTTLVSSSVNPSIVGQSVAFTATVSSAGATTPTGSVALFDGASQIGSGNLDSTGAVGFQTSTLAVGTHAITVKYGGDTNSTSSTSANLTQIVNGIQTSTSLTSSMNPSVVGQSVTLTATVSGTGGTPTGSVTFYDGATSLGTSTLAAGKTTLITSALVIGNHSIRALYSGDAIFSGSTSPTLVQMVNGKQSATALVSSLNPEVDGQSVTFTATVTSTAGGIPTGEVTFFNGTTLLGTGSLSASGLATYVTTGLAVGSQSITAIYGGDANYVTSTSQPVTETVSLAGFALVSTVPPVTAGQNAVINLTIYAASGSNLNFVLNCSGGLPSKSSCSFSPNPVTPGPPPNGTTVQMTFSTASSGLPANPSNRSPWPMETLGISTALAALLAAGMIQSRRTPRRRLAFGIWIAVFALASVLIGCGSSSGSGSVSGYTGTPKGPAIITITGTSGPTTISTQLTVTVQ